MAENEAVKCRSIFFLQTKNALKTEISGQGAVYFFWRSHWHLLNESQAQLKKNLFPYIDEVSLPS